MIVHTLNKPPSMPAAQQALAALGEKDVLVLIEEGVHAVLHPSWNGWQLGERLVLLQEDLDARGLASLARSKALPSITVDEFVALTVSCDNIIAWY
ncbi:DsrH/TusB family sulfur relay protein [Halomonas dongshanensis]|uniref:Sulfurtransferase complex subunit TusB n=1 Tax=Halomonas dongshanensis TaxID=2890835 RepID=A0ABT2EG75_9GAMM|nr:DsrH/TusB family sulfur metabolism protein [Halomonas dongshanensis]MCS2610583.1 sulfurtransferase complex subunit TusB [Halomonas dongshanensis]